MTWNEKQLAAINYPDTDSSADTHSAVVTAAAGSGKTALLAERVCRIIKDENNPIPADRIAVLTFTNNAAGEFRHRMTAKISELAKSDRKNAYLSEQLIKFRSASISTINAFCLGILRDNADIFELPVSFSIIDETKAAVLRAEAMDITMEYFYSEKFPAYSRELLFKTFSMDSDRELIEKIDDIFSKVSSLTDHIKWLDECAESYSSFESAEKRFIPYYASAIESRIEAMRGSCERYSAMIRRLISGQSLDSKDIRRLEKDILEYEQSILENAESRFEEIRTAPTLDKLNRFAERVGEIGGAPVKFAQLRLKYKGGEVKEIGAVRDLFKKALKEIAELIPDRTEAEEALEFQYTAISAFVDLVKRYESEFTRLKRSAGYVDFADCEQLLLEKLRENDSFRRSISDRYRCIVVDEFQDTNDLQYEIFRLISKNERNLFFVGDIKQSIYGFRGGNPRIMMRLCDTECTEYDTLPLNMNYRSRESVIRTVNAMFDGLMTREHGDVDYDSDARLVCGAAYPLPEEDGYTSELHVLDFSAKGKSDKTENIVYEAEYTAGLIKKMVDGRFQVKDELHPEATRDCTYGDFAVLLRSAAHAKEFKDALEKLGAPADIGASANYLATEEITLILNLLKVIDNPMSDVELLSVLMSPLFMMTADELGKARLGTLGIPSRELEGRELTPLYDKYKYRSLYACIKACSEPHRPRENDGSPAEGLERLRSKGDAKCAAFIGALNKFRDFKGSNSIESLIGKIYDDTDFYSVIATYERAEQKLANIRLLLKYAADFENSGGGTLSEFLRYTDRLRERNESFEDAKTAEAAGNAVRIMTYHKSKGLEMPVVLLAQLGKKENTSDRTDTLIFNREAGLGIKHLDIEHRYITNTLGYNAVAAAERNKQRSEELRLLYVAMTRAREKLIMIGGYDISKINEKLRTERFTPGFALSDGFGRVITWILASMLRYENSGAVFTDNGSITLDGGVLRLISRTLPIEAQPCESTADTADAPKEKPPAILPDLEAAERISAAVTAKYEHEADSSAQSKYTVTQIAHASDKHDDSDDEGSDTGHARRPYRDGGTDAAPHSSGRFFLPKPAFMRSKKKKLTGSALGNAYHSVMEHFPLARLAAGKQADADYIGEELDRLADRELITSEERESVDSNAIAGFFNSELGRRMLKSPKIEREYSIFAEVAARDIFVDRDGSAIIQGRTDMFFYEEDGIVIVDYKSDRESTLKSNTEEYFTQLSIYRTILPLLTGVRVKQIYLYSFTLGRAIEESKKETWN